MFTRFYAELEPRGKSFFTSKTFFHSVDNWAYYKDYLTSALKQQTPSECLEFLNKISTTSARRVRAPLLGRFELLKRIDASDELRSKLDTVDLMRQYFVQFGEKGCVVGDLKLYLNVLEPSEQLELLRKVRTTIDS